MTRTVTSLTLTASTNLVGKFTQSVRRIVQDVKDEGTSSGQTKEEVIETNERLRNVRVRLDENYDTAKKALVTLMARYSESKAQRNVFTRYAMLKAMIKLGNTTDSTIKAISNVKFDLTSKKSNNLSTLILLNIKMET
ncbi:unnamed protein product [Diatraea saccharalis]|uniref:Uncharacterized protein n=1 Tax=Diatraea saccharalis TaxID=40085 RepID=A0A9N9REE6_9NEOP|nr:unnamed protein product [Diatraea saccharalis]